MPRTALIVGVTGEVVTSLAETLRRRQYDVHAVIVGQSHTGRLAGATVHRTDLSDGSSVFGLLNRVQPREVYSLTGLILPADSAELPVRTADVMGLGVLRLLEAVRQLPDRIGAQVRFVQVSSQELLAGPADSLSNKKTAFQPATPVGCAGLFAYWQTVNARDAYGLYACNGVLLDHTPPEDHRDQRPREVTPSAVRIKRGLQRELPISDVKAQRELECAGDFAEALWMMLQQETPDDYVVEIGFV